MLSGSCFLTRPAFAPNGRYDPGIFSSGSWRTII
jgi:hypothetical protein